ncbi:MAG TPA: SpoIIE family protein phosphatase [Acidobacteriaceae bacterium]|nr:SpoIIE family protein phosphatase [Acidobacteriaceae bacterium]
MNFIKTTTAGERAVAISSVQRILLGLCLAALQVMLFTASAQALPSKTQSVKPDEIVRFGTSAIELAGPWKFQPGDSPSFDGEPLWAQPTFNDSRWYSMDMTAREGTVDPFYSNENFLPGWTERGFPKLSGYAWYRLTVKVQDAGESLWLKMPANVDDAYQVYADGRLVGNFGEFRPDGVDVYYARPEAFHIPQISRNGLITIAIRFYLESDTAFIDPAVGGMHSAPVLGLASTIQRLQERDDDAAFHSRLVSGVLMPMLFILTLPLVIWAWFQNRSERAYLWLAATIVCYIAEAAFTNLLNHDILPSDPGDLLREAAHVAILPCWIYFWLHWFSVDRSHWFARITTVLFVVDLISMESLHVPFYGGIVPFTWASWLTPLNSTLGLAEGILLIFILVQGFREHATEALLALLPVLLVIFSAFSSMLLARFSFRSSFTVLGIAIGVGQLASFVLLLLIGALAVRRFLATHAAQQRQQQAIEVELEQASELQQRVLIPEPVRSKVYAVDTAYFPAQSVGGDFFQVLGNPDGSLLVVLGDVSGKGVSAAMLVAVLVGAIRTRAEQSFDPFAMLRMLNARLTGRSSGHFATCLAMHLRADGTVSIANAGHLPPFLNGREIATPGALPLGLIREPEFSSAIVRLSPDDKLMLLSDGVVEAMSDSRELFGFDRTRVLSRGSAYDMADAARRFGQQDDITALTIQFAGAFEAVAV